MKDKESKYFTASKYYVIGNVVGQGIVLLSSIVFTRIMSKEAYGLINTYSAWVLVLNTFIGLNLFITVRNAYLDYYKSYKKFVSSVLLFSLFAFIIIIFAIIGGIKLLHFKVDIFIVFLAMLQAISLHTINYQMAVLSMENKYKARTILMVFPNVLHILLSVLFIYIYSTNQYFGKIVGNVLGLMIFALFIIVFVFKEYRPEINVEYWKYAAMISVPAIFCTLSDLILMQSDRIMITHMVGAKETAVYSLVYNIGSIIIALYTAINGAWVPWLFMKIEEKEDAKICRIEKLYLKIFTLGTIGLLTISPEIIKILSPKSYWKGIDYVNLIVIASFLIFIYSFFTSYLSYLKKTGKIAVNTLIASALNLVLNYLWIQKYKAVGAAYATIISYVVLFILHYLVTIKYNNKIFCLRSMAKCIGLVIGYGILFYFIRNSILIRFILLIIILAFTFITLLQFSKQMKSSKIISERKE